MKKIIFLMSITCLTSAIQAKNLIAFFSYSSFDVPGKQGYIETYLNVVGNTVNFIPATNNNLKGQIEVRWIIRENDKIVYADKYILNSPEIPSGSSSSPDFVDLQRVPLKRGTYQIELAIRDKNSDSKEFALKENIDFGFPADTLSISDIELIESYTKTDQVGKFFKSGFDIIPFVNAFYPKENSALKFYAEVYRTDIAPADVYLVRYYISGKESRQIQENYIVSQKQNPMNINPIIGEFNIADLTSGNYYLNIEVRNKSNKIIAFKNMFFQRSNERSKPEVTADINAIDVSNTFISSVYNPDTLRDYIACLFPIASSIEVITGETQIEVGDIHNMQQYIYYFWSRRNRENPEAAWQEYKPQVVKVNNLYSSLNNKGYETDRGRVYLQYGAPNAIAEVKNDPNSYPYEIWQYYKLDNQSNRKFVFYSTDLSTNDYRLIHSDAKGELKEPKWELMMHGRTQQFGNDMDQENSIDTYGSRTKEDFVNPR